MPPVADILTSPTEVDEGVRFASSGIAIGSGPDDPSLSGVVATVGDYWYRTNGEIWRKTGAGDTAWTLITTIDAESHRNLDQLVHNIAEDSFEEVIRSGNFVTDVIVWTDSGKTTKIRETNISRSGGLVSQVVIKHYNAAGSLVYTLTETYNRSGNFVASIDRVLT